MTDEEKATVEGLVNIEEAVIREEMDYDVNELAANVEETVPKFTASQQVDRYLFQPIFCMYNIFRQSMIL